MGAYILEEKFTQLLKLTGYIKHITQHGTGAGYIYGPAGALLRDNIRKSWWKTMITGRENTFPVEGDSDLLGFYPEVSELMCNKLPFSVASLNQMKQDELPPQEHQNKFLFNSSVFTEMKLVHFHFPSASSQEFDEILGTRLQWWKLFSGNPSNFSLIDAGIEESLNSNGIQYEFPWGQETIERVINRGDKPLKALESRTGHSCQCKHGRKSVYPHQIECQTALEVAMATYLIDAYREKDVARKKAEQQKRQIMQIHPVLAPFKVAMATSGSKSRELREVAGYITREMRAAGIPALDIDDDNSLEKNTARNDCMGIPFTVVVNDNTLETGVIGLRNRDTTLKEQVAVSKVVETVQRHLAC